MARNETGIYSLPSGNPVVSGTTISVTWANNTLNDIASALTQSVSKDGQTVMTGPQNFGGFKITNLASGTTSGDAVHFGQLALKLDATGGSVSNLTVSDGTANGIPYLNASKVLTSGTALTFDGANLGVGTTAPAYSVDVRNAASSALRVGSNSNAFGSLLSWDNASGTGRLWTLGAYDFVFGVNSSEQMRLTSAGLGIGTASPGAKLHVNGWVRSGAGASAAGGFEIPDNGSSAGSRTWRVRNDVNQYGDFSIQTATALGGTTFVDRLNLDPSGNLGLGVVPSAGWRTGARALQSGATGYVSLNEQANGSASLNFNCYESAANTWSYYVTGVAPTRYAQLSGQHTWFTAPSGTAGGAITFTQAMTLDASSNLAVTGTVTGTNLYAQSQTWQNVTGSRAIGTSYTNSTARPIEVQTSVASAGGTVNFYMNMNGTYIRVGVAVAGSSECAITVTVPPGQTYGVSTANGSMSSAGAGALAGWNELR
jgi:hypothetical protein